MIISTPNTFDRSKPFYPIVINFIVQIFGFRNLACWGVIGWKKTDTVIDNFVNSFDGESSMKDDLKNKLKKLYGPLNLSSEYQNSNIDIDIEFIAKEIYSNAFYLAPYTIKAASSVLVLAHEYCKEKEYHDQGPLWEFLRHCRNAAAHGGYFTFKHGEPRRLAKWGNINIEKSLKGTLLFKDDKKVGLLSIGDPIRLLWDIEQKYPQMKA
jgi:hypothetical protein